MQRGRKENPSFRQQSILGRPFAQEVPFDGGGGSRTSVYEVLKLPQLLWLGSLNNYAVVCSFCRGLEGTKNIRRAPSSHEIGENGREMEEAPDTQGVVPQNWGGTELYRNATYMVLKATVNDKRTSSPLP
ncbi:hypothetical protein TNCV_2890311 [Trichonephila clavipes]|nr:hypothetical protein TNCV_2890311 [Trichonephila clavipes]